MYLYIYIFFFFTGIIIKYFSTTQKAIVTPFFKFAELIERNATEIVDVLKRALEEFKLDLHKMCGLGTDNASAMVGVNNGVINKLQDENPNIILIHCVCHSLQLCVSSAAKECLSRNLEYLISETYNWFAHSTLRRNAYLHDFKCINDGHDPLKIVQSCTTRWLSIETAVTRIVEQWRELKTQIVKRKFYINHLTMIQTLLI